MSSSYQSRCIQDPARGRSLCCCVTPATCWVPLALAFDGTGNLFVEAVAMSGSSYAWQTAIWRFGPDDPLMLDASSPACLTPGGLSLGAVYGTDTHFAVSPDGTVFAHVVMDDGSEAVLKVPPGQQPYDVDPLPVPPSQYARYDWSLAGDCMGRPLRSPWGPCRP